MCVSEDLEGRVLIGETLAGGGCGRRSERHGRPRAGLPRALLASGRARSVRAAAARPAGPTRSGTLAERLAAAITAGGSAAALNGAGVLGTSAVVVGGAVGGAFETPPDAAPPDRRARGPRTVARSAEPPRAQPHHAYRAGVHCSSPFPVSIRSATRVPTRPRATATKAPRFGPPRSREGPNRMAHGRPADRQAPAGAWSYRDASRASVNAPSMSPKSRNATS
jgi:hypothetical protein